MKLVAVSIKNFRGFRNTGYVQIGDIIGLVGRNDAGKSTFLDALELFFDHGAKLCEEDRSRMVGDAAKVEITCVFSEVPKFVIIDKTEKTTLLDEYLLNERGALCVKKCYLPNQKAEVQFKCVHPSHSKCLDLLRKKDSDLRIRIEKEGIHCEDCTSNVQMRKAIREHFKETIELKNQHVPLKPDMCEKLLGYLPRYCLFRADRDNSETDSEVRDPISDVVQQFFKQGIIGDHLKSVADEVLAG